MLTSLNSPAPTYCCKRHRGKEDGKESLERKRKVLHLVSQWTTLYRDFLREDEHVKLFMKVQREAENGGKRRELPAINVMMGRL